MGKKKSYKIGWVYLLGMALATAGFICPMFKLDVMFGTSTWNGFSLINFDHSSFVTVAALLVFIGAAAGVLMALCPSKKSTATLIKFVCLLVSIIGGVVMVIGFTQDSFYQFIGKQIFKHAYYGFYMLLAGWVVALIGLVTKK